MTTPNRVASLHRFALALGCVLLSLLLEPSVAQAQSESASGTRAQVSTQCWLLLGGDQFKRRIEEIASDPMRPTATAMRSLLVEAEHAGQIKVLLQRQLASADQAAATLNALVELPPTADSNDQAPRDRNIFVYLSVTPQIQSGDEMLLALRLDMKALVPKLPIGEASALIGPRSTASKAILSAGAALLLNVSSGDTATLLRPTSVKGQDLLLLLAPNVIESGTRGQRQ